MTDITKYKNVSLSKKTYMDVGTLSKEIFEVPLSLSKTIEYLVEKEMKKWLWRYKDGGQFAKA